MISSERKKCIFKAVKLIAKILWWTVTALLVLLLFNIIVAKMRGKIPSVFGYSVINIVSGSMEDTIPKGSYILIKKTHPKDVKKNDIICFHSSDPTIYGMPNTHRVIDVEESNGNYRFLTRGDANPVNDTHLAEGDRLVGVYVKTMKGLTKFSNMISGNLTIIVIICLQIGLVSMFVYTSVITRKAKEQTEEKQEKTEKEEKDGE